MHPQYNPHPIYITIYTLPSHTHSMRAACVRAVAQARDTLLTTCLELIASWTQQHGKGGTPKAAAPSTDGSSSPSGAAGAAPRSAAVAPGSFLGLLLSARDKATGAAALSDVQITGQAQTFILAGAPRRGGGKGWACTCACGLASLEGWSGPPCTHARMASAHVHACIRAHVDTQSAGGAEPCA